MCKKHCLITLAAATLVLGLAAVGVAATEGGDKNIKIQIYSKEGVAIKELGTVDVNEGQTLILRVQACWDPYDPSKPIYLWTGELPPGAYLRPPGCTWGYGCAEDTLFWTPGYCQAGTYVVTWYAGGACGSPTYAHPVTIIVHNVNRPPTVTANPPGPITVQAGDSVYIQVTTSDPDADTCGDDGLYTLNYNMSPTPSTTPTLTAIDGIYNFNWQTTLADGGKTYTVTFYVSDYYGGSDSTDVQITVESIPREWIAFDEMPVGTPPDIEVIECGPYETILRITLHGMWVEDTLMWGEVPFQIVTIPEMVTTPELGKPMLPAIGEMIGLATDVEAIEVTNVYITDSLGFGDLNIFPLQAQPKSEYEPEFAIDWEFYEAYDDWYPPATVETGPVGFWHILPVCNIRIHPIKYNPVTDTLKVYRVMEVTFSHSGAIITDTIPRLYATLYEDLINWHCIKDYLIFDLKKFKPHKLFIVADALINNPCIRKLVNYEKKKGFNTTLMKATAAGGSPPSPDSIKKTIKKFYESPACRNKPKYVVLIGDHDKVPAKKDKFGLSDSALAPDVDVLSDEWYELVKGNDYVPDLFLGRLPANDSATICHIISKKIKYDTTAHAGVTKELLVAHKQNRKADRGDGNIKEFTYKACKELIKNKLKACGFQTVQVYGSDGGTKNNVKNEIENGVGEINYNGHGSPTAWDGWDKNGKDWGINDVNGLNNTCKEPLIWSTGCYNNKIDHATDCIGEAWLKKCKAVAHFGSSRASPTKHSNYLDRFIHEAICEFKRKGGTAELGAIIQKAKRKLAAKFNPGGPAIDNEFSKLTILEYLLLGDPETRKWTDTPKRPKVNHSKHIPLGTQDFVVTVTYQGTPVAGAPVCLLGLKKKGTEENEIFDGLYTDDAGTAVFAISPATPGTLWVTVSGGNWIPYQSTVLVTTICTLRVADAFGAPSSSNNPMDVELNNSIGVGGVEFTLAFDGTRLTADSATTTTRSSHMTLSYTSGPDSIKVIMFSMTGDSISPGTGPIVTIFFSVDTSAVAGDSTLVHLKSAVVSDPHANPISVITEDGWFSFRGMKCDVNNDGNINVIDIVRMVNIILGRPPSPTSYELWAADCNGDGAVNVIDIVCCINRILGRPGTNKEGHSSATIEVPEMPVQVGKTITIPISIDTDVPVAGVQFKLSYDANKVTPGTPQLTERSADMTIASDVRDDKLIVLIYSETGKVIPAGSGPIINIPITIAEDVQSESSLHLDEVILVSPDAQQIQVESPRISLKLGRPVPKVYALLQNYPNPFTRSTVISYLLPDKQHVTLRVYDLIGRVVRTLVDEEQKAGYYKVRWNGRNELGKPVSSGIYFYQIQAGEFTSIKKLVVLR